MRLFVVQQSVKLTLALTWFRMFLKSKTKSQILWQSSMFCANLFFCISSPGFCQNWYTKFINQVQSNIQSRFSTNVNRLHLINLEMKRSQKLKWVHYTLQLSISNSLLLHLLPNLQEPWWNRDEFMVSTELQCQNLRR